MRLHLFAITPLIAYGVPYLFHDGLVLPIVVGKKEPLATYLLEQRLGETKN